MPEHLSSVKDALFENIFNNAPNGIAIVGLDFRWIKINQSLMDLLGYPEEEFYAMTFNDITHKDDQDLDMLYLGQLLEQDISSYQIEKRYFHKNGTLLWVLLSVSLEVDRNGEPLYFISQIMDITKRKDSSWQMKSISEIVQKQNEKLLDFAHIATHDIRTHIGNLNTITGFIEEENEIVHDDVNFSMLKESLLQLDETLVNLNKIRNEEFSTEQHMKPLKLSQFIDYAIYNVNAIARNQKCSVINNVDQSVEIMATEVYLDSIILNFLTNAIKYSCKDCNSFVELSTSEKDDYVILKIRDNGLGIDLNRNGNQLFKFKKTFHEHPEAQGIGLFITKNHVESLGGKIEVESEKGVGSTFNIFFKRGLTRDTRDETRDTRHKI